MDLPRNFMRARGLGQPVLAPGACRDVCRSLRPKIISLFPPSERSCNCKIFPSIPPHESATPLFLRVRIQCLFRRIEPCVV